MKSGNEMREKLREQMEKGKEAATRSFKSAQQALRKQMERGREAVARPLKGAERALYFQAKLDCEIVPHDLNRRLEAGEKNLLVLDVRDSESFNQEHIPGAKNIPLDELPKRFPNCPERARSSRTAGASPA